MSLHAHQTNTASRDRTAAEGLDLLLGAEEIAAFLNLTPRQVYRLQRRHELPTFRFAGKIAARRSTLLAAIERREAGAR